LAKLVKLRYFSGLSHLQAAEALGISRRVADRVWSVAKAWHRHGPIVQRCKINVPIRRHR
jgi:hypothetical protein